MWIMTDFGFFSVAQELNKDVLTVRARVREDLERFRDRYLPGAEIVDTPRGDYPYRMRVLHEAFAEAMRKVSLGIDYDNFKRTVGEKMGRSRATIYSGIWSILHGIEVENRPNVPTGFQSERRDRT